MVRVRARHDPRRASVQVDAPQVGDGQVKAGALSIVAYVDRYVPWANAGGEWALHHTLAPLAAAGHQADVVSLSWPEGTLAPLVVDGVRVWPADRAGVVLAAADVLLTHLGGTKHALRAAAARTLPVVYLLHNDEQIRHWSLIPADVTGVVFNTRWLEAATLHRHPLWAGVPSAVVHPPVSSIDYEVPGAGFDRRFVTLVNTCPAKGGPLFYDLAEACPGREFLAVEGAYGQQLRPRQPQHRNVTWCRQTPRMRENVYAHTRVLLVPSVYESFGRVAAEAMAAGIPVIAHPTPGLVECLDEAGIYADRDRPAEWLRWLGMLDDRGFYDNVVARGLARARDAEARTVAELCDLEQLLRRAAAADRSALPSPGMPKHDPFRGTRRARTVDISATAAVGPQEAPEGPPALTGATETERAREAGLEGNAAVMEMAAKMDAAAGQDATEGALAGGESPEDGSPIEVDDPSLMTLTDAEVAEIAAAAELADAATAALDLGAITPDQHDLVLERIGRGEEIPSDLAEGIERASEPASHTPQGSGDDEGQPSPEPEPTTTGTASGDASADPEAAPPKLVGLVPAKATGDDGVVAWINSAVSETLRYDRAEAAEWVEQRRPNGPRKAVTAAVEPVLYD